MNIGPTELIVVLIIALLVFGPRKLPEIGRSVGKSVREFQRAAQEIRQELRIDLDEEPPRVDAPVPRATTHRESTAEPSPATERAEGPGDAPAGTPAEEDIARDQETHGAPNGDLNGRAGGPGPA